MWVRDKNFQDMMLLRGDRRGGNYGTQYKSHQSQDFYSILAHMLLGRMRKK
jgi:hypothetical protein